MDTTHSHEESISGLPEPGSSPEELLERLTDVDAAEAPPVADQLAKVLAADLDAPDEEPAT